MKIAIESTAKVVNLNGVPARIWEGKTETGIPVHCYVTRIAVARDEDCSQFERELQEHRPPSVDVAVIPPYLVL
jgi:hypothetical protein